ncbi:MAG: hypothetical protein L3J39_17820 [Verrucomicrobiales bacterium]|nr:hypothetical protein [Verrucomicrobiales bacterium]
MKTVWTLPFLILLAGYAIAEEPITFLPIPPVGAKITRTSEGVIRIEMSESGTVILGTSQVISREGNRPDLPGRYHIEFKATGKMITQTENSYVSLVIYHNKGPFKVNAAYGGRDISSSTKVWSRMRTTYLAKSGGADKVEKVILGIYFKDPGTIELKDLSCRSVDLPSD